MKISVLQTLFFFFCIIRTLLGNDTNQGLNPRLYTTEDAYKDSLMYNGANSKGIFAQYS